MIERVTWTASTMPETCVSGFPDFNSPQIAYQYPSGALEDYPLQVLDHSDGVIHITYKGIKHISASGVLTWWTQWAGNRNSYAHGFLLDDNHVILEGAIWDNGTRNNTSLNDYNTYVATPYSTIQAADGTMWVVDDSRWIWQFDASGNLLKEINGNEFTGLGTTIPDACIGLFLDGNILYVASWEGVFAADITTMTQPYPGAEPNYWVLQFDRLFNSSNGSVARLESGICVHGGKVYFTDWGAIGSRPTRILSVDPAGGTDQTATVEYEANSADGTQDANFQNITVIDGDLYVASEGDLRVYVFLNCPGGCSNFITLGWITFSPC